MAYTNYPHGLTSFGVPLFGGYGGPIGLGMGNLYYMVEAKVSTNLYYVRLQENGISDTDIFTTLATAYAATASGQNDVIVVTPGVYTSTASLAWANDSTHLAGLGGPLQGHYRTSAASDLSNVVLHTITASVAEVINVTGANCQFYNLQVHNEGDDADNVAAVKVNGRNFYAKNMNFRGATSTAGIAAVEAGSLYIHDDADYCMFEDCTIGHNTYTAGARTGIGSGHLVFSTASGTSGPQNGYFRNCYFPLRTQTTTVGHIRGVGNPGVDRDWIFDNCLFTNWWVNFGDNIASVFVGQWASPNVILKNCVAQGADYWHAAGGSHTMGNMCAVDTGGGLVRVMSQTAYAGADR